MKKEEVKRSGKRRNPRGKKIIAAILMMTMGINLLPTLFPSVVMAADETLISDRSGLESISGSGSYLLTADIDLGGAAWTPLTEFSGTLNGGGHVIRNLSITDTTTASGNNKGLFAAIGADGRVFDLGIESADITAYDKTGVFAGENYGTISRCYALGTVNGGSNVGGIVGINGGTIENCYSKTSVSGKDYLGGIAGNNTGTMTKSYSVSTVMDSVMNNYLQFNATSSSGGWIEIPHSDAYTGTAFTLEAWFQWDDVDTNNIGFITGKGYERFEIHTGGNSGINGLRFIPIPSGEKDPSCGGYASDSYIDVHNMLQSGWFHVAAVYWYDSGMQKANTQVYVNGEAQDLWQIPLTGGAAVNVGKTATLSRTSNPLSDSANSENINIGRRTDASFYFDGKIADVRFWNTARTGEQIKDNKDKVLVGNETGLVGYWRLNESEGNAIDSSTNQNNGTVNGDVTRIVSAGEAAHKGGLVGSNSGTITNCYNDSSLCGLESGGAGLAKSTEEMKNTATYVDWDFNKVWKPEAGNYPLLRTNAAVNVFGGTTDKNIAAEGEIVTITAGAPLTDQRFKEWTITPTVTFLDGTSATSETAKFTMPASTVTTTAVYETIPNTLPVISGIENGETYQKTQYFTVSDYDLKDTDAITIDGQTATAEALGEHVGSYRLVPKDSGSYTIVATDKKENKTSYTVTVLREEVTVPVIAAKNYNGQTQTADIITSGLYEITTNTGGTNVTSVGYDVALTLNDATNYKWKTDDSRTDCIINQAAGTVFIIFQITKAINTFTTAPACNGFTYNGNAAQASAVAAFGSPVYTYYKNAGCTSKTSTEDGATVAGGAPKNAGTYYVKATVAGTGNYTALDSNPVSFVIGQADQEAPTVGHTDVSYTGHTDGIICDMKTGMEWTATPGEDNSWKKVTPDQITAGKITGLPVGTYYIRRKADRNYNISAVATVVIDSKIKTPVKVFIAPPVYNKDHLDQVTVKGTVTKGEYDVTAESFSYCKEGDSSWTIISTIGSDVTLTGLSSDTIYELKLTATDSHGNVATDIQKFRTLQLSVETGKITGSVDGDNSKKFSVSIKKGSTTVGTLTGLSKGDSFTFSNLADGEYNLEVTDGEFKVTIMVTVKKGSTENLGIVKVTEKQTVVEVQDGAPDVAVGGLGDVFDTTVVTDNSDVHTVLHNGGTIEIRLTASETTEETSIKKLTGKADAGGKVIGIMTDFNVDMIVIPLSGDTTISSITDTEKLILIAILLPEGAKGKTGYQAYRVHDGETQTLVELGSSERVNPVKEGFYIDGDYLYVVARYFSSYALAYDKETDPSNPVDPSKPEDTSDPSKPGDTSNQSKPTDTSDSTDDSKPTDSEGYDSNKDDAQDGTDRPIKNDCNWHWYMLLLMAGYVIFVMVGKNKFIKLTAAVFVVDVILTIILILLGSCGMDIPFAVGTLVVTGASVPVKRMISKNKEEDDDDIEE